jgi:Flp pilus assembly protein TadB
MTFTLILLAVVGVAFLWWMRRRRQRMLDEALRKRSLDQETKPAETPAQDEQQADSLPPS